MLARDKFLPELHLRQPRFSYYSTCGPFAKHHAGFKNGLLSMVYNLLQKKTGSQAITISKGSAIKMKNLPKNYTNQWLKIQKRESLYKVKDNI